MKLENSIVIRVGNVDVDEEMKFLEKHWIDYSIYTDSRGMRLLEINIHYILLQGILAKLDFLSERYSINIDLLKHSDYLQVVERKF